MYCTNCGKPLPEPSSYCPYCGKAASLAQGTLPHSDTSAQDETQDINATASNEPIIHHANRCSTADDAAKENARNIADAVSTNQAGNKERLRKMTLIAGAILLLLWLLFVIPPLVGINPRTSEAALNKSNIIIGRTSIIICLGIIAGSVIAIMPIVDILQGKNSKRSPGGSAAIGAICVFLIADMLIFVLFAGGGLMSGVVHTAIVDGQRPVRLLLSMALSVAFALYVMHVLSARQK